MSVQNDLIICIKMDKSHMWTYLRLLKINVSINYFVLAFNQHTFRKAFILSPAFPNAKPERQKKVVLLLRNTLGSTLKKQRGGKKKKETNKA